MLRTLNPFNPEFDYDSFIKDKRISNFVEGRSSQGVARKEIPSVSQIQDADGIQRERAVRKYVEEMLK